MTGDAEFQSPRGSSSTRVSDERCIRRPSRSAQRPVRRYPRQTPEAPGFAGPPTGCAGTAQIPASRPGAIGGAVIRAARGSAGLYRHQLAHAASISVGVVRAWESGTIALFCASYHQLSRLADTLDRAGATVGRDVRDLVRASQCDLLLTGMLHGFEDYAEVPPIEENSADAVACRDLLRWALTGTVPTTYSSYAVSHAPLLSGNEINALAAIARELQAGERGRELTSYGSAVLKLTHY